MGDLDLKIGKEYFMFLTDSGIFWQEIVRKKNPRKPRVDEISFLALVRVIRKLSITSLISALGRLYEVEFLKVFKQDTLKVRVGQTMLIPEKWIKLGKEAFSIWFNKISNPSMSKRYYLDDKRRGHKSR